MSYIDDFSGYSDFSGGYVEAPSFDPVPAFVPEPLPVALPPPPDTFAPAADPNPWASFLGPPPPPAPIPAAMEPPKVEFPEALAAELQPRADTERKDLTGRLDGVRIQRQGVEQNIARGEAELENLRANYVTRFISWSTNTTSAAEETIRNDRARLVVLDQKQQQLEQAIAAIDRGETAPEVSRLGYSGANLGIRNANASLADAAENARKTEVVLRTTRDVAVVTAAVVATGGAAAAGVGVVGAVGLGTGAGTAVGVLSSGTEQAGHVALGNKDGETAERDFVQQVKRDAQASFTASVGTVAGLGVTSRLAPEGVGFARSVVGTALGGGVNSTTSTALNQAIDVSTGQRKLDPAQLFEELLIDGTVGTLGGGLGRSVAGTSGLTQFVAQSTGDAVFGLGGAALKAKIEDRDLELDDFVQQVGGAVVGNTFGHVSQKVQEQAARRNAAPEPEPRATAAEPIDAAPTLRRIRGEAELNNADVARTLNEQLIPIKANDVDQIIAGFPPEQQAQARTVLARGSGFANIDSLNQVRRTLEPYLSNGRELFLPGKGSLADNIAYIAEKDTFRGIGSNDLPTSTSIKRDGSVAIADAVLLDRVQRDPTFARRLIDENVALLSPRGFNDGLNFFNTPDVETIATRTSTILENAQKLQAESKGRLSFEEAVVDALDRRTLQILGDADPRLLNRVAVFDASSVDVDTSDAISRRLSGKAGLATEDLNRVLSDIPAKYHEVARELLANEGRVYSPRRIAQEISEQHENLIQLAPLRGVDPREIYFLVPAKKSYETLALAHREVTGTPVDRYIEGYDELRSRNLGKNSLLFVFDDVAGSGESLANVSRMVRGSTAYDGLLVVTPLVSTQNARKAFAESSLDNVFYSPARGVSSLDNSPFYRQLSPENRDLVRLLTDQWGFGKNGLSLSFPYMAPDNNNRFFGERVAPAFILNRNRSASKAGSYSPPTQ